MLNLTKNKDFSASMHRSLFVLILSLQISQLFDRAINTISMQQVQTQSALDKNMLKQVKTGSTFVSMYSSTIQEQAPLANYIYTRLLCGMWRLSIYLVIIDVSSLCIPLQTKLLNFLDHISSSQMYLKQ